jgi:hypothetical protein
MEARDSSHVSAPTNVHLLLTLDPDADDEELERSARQLRAELLNLDAESVTLVRSGETAAGAKVADPVTVGAIIVALSASGGVLTTLIDTVGDWLARRSSAHKVVVTIEGDTIELDNATADEQRDIVKAYIHRHVTQAE